MGSERYVRPPLLAREAAPAWIAVWRFRLAALAALAVLVLVAVLVIRSLTGANSQDPGIGALSPAPVGSGPVASGPVASGPVLTG